jgi:hypothetical protein
MYYIYILNVTFHISNITHFGIASGLLLVMLMAIVGIAPLLTQNGNVTATMAQRETVPFFAFVYDKTGGIKGVMNTISYDSSTKQLNIVSNGNQTQKILSQQEEDTLKEAISNSRFFEAMSFYPPTGGADFFEYILIVTMNGQLQAVYWTDVSKDLPDSLSNAIAVIEKLASS